jgi:hypothetical protein
MCVSDSGTRREKEDGRWVETRTTKKEKKKRKRKTIGSERKNATR